jgi:hypothetical protein
MTENLTGAVGEFLDYVHEEGQRAGVTDLTSTKLRPALVVVLSSGLSSFLC